MLGTVLAIPIDEARYVPAQVLHLDGGPSFYLAVSTATCTDIAQNQCDKLTELRLFSWTNDAEVYKGRWKNLGVYDLPERMPPTPEYKLGPSTDMTVWSFDGKKLRQFEEARDSLLNFKTSRSPLLVEDAAKAMHGIIDWLPHLEKMKRP